MAGRGIAKDGRGVVLRSRGMLFADGEALMTPVHRQCGPSACQPGRLVKCRVMSAESAGMGSAAGEGSLLLNVEALA